MYMELTPQDTVRDLQRLLVDAIPGFEFPRVNLYDYVIETAKMKEDELVSDDFVLGVVWGTIPDPNETPEVLVEHSHFGVDLTPEEINILALLMKTAWLERQINSVENTRMKYSGSDFKMTSQANHLSKLLQLKSENVRESTHAQRLYKRRKFTSNGQVKSNWSVLNTSTFDDIRVTQPTVPEGGSSGSGNGNNKDDCDHTEYVWEPI